MANQHPLPNNLGFRALYAIQHMTFGAEVCQK